MFRVMIALAWLLALAAYAPTLGQGVYHENDKVYENIDVMSLPESDCTMQRGRTTFASFRLPSSDGRVLRLRHVRVDVTQSHAEIIVTCSKSGYVSQSKAISYGPISWVSDGPPCMPPTDMAADKRNYFCRHYQSSSNAVISEYPEAVRLYLNRKPVQ
jgi:hypothetical protein